MSAENTTLSLSVNTETQNSEPAIPEGLRILCFDGGGVRGKASLLILKEVMERVGPGAKPCDFFDLIAGTSTGSLIAIMLARLHYTVDEAINKYDELSPRIFSNLETATHWILYGNPVVYERPAEEAFQEIGKVDGQDVLMNNGTYDRCKCFVTTVLQDQPRKLVPIRSYHSSDTLDPVRYAGIQWKIWEAARAATAAPVYFKPFEIADRKFVDAGAGYNNPSEEVYHEVTENIPEYDGRPIACFVSIGTGDCEPQPAPGTSERSDSIFGSLPNFPRTRAIQGRASDLVQYLSNIASATERVHREMGRTYMKNGPYFRFDPGPAVGSIILTDISRLREMRSLVWDHLERNSTVREHINECVKALKAASRSAVEALSRPVLSPTSRPSTTSTHPSRTNGQAHFPAIPENWQSLAACTEMVLENPDTVPTFLTMFSLSHNFDCVLEALDNLANKSLLSDPSETFETKIGTFKLLNAFVSQLWLTDLQISHCESFVPDSTPSIRAVAWAASDLSKSLEDTKRNNEVAIQDPINSLDNEATLGVLAGELAEALAVLEDKLRQTDAVGECVRWLAKRHARNFLSFPERVELWVPRAILLSGEPQHVGLRYLLFYKVAKRSKDLHNFSAMRAIVSGLQLLERIRIDARVKTTELESMKRLGYGTEKSDAETAQRKMKPYLQSLHDLLHSKFTVDIYDIADNRHNVHWGTYKTFIRLVEDFTSQNKLTSPERYVFGRDRVVGFVKKSLINVERVDNINRGIENTIRGYRKAREPPDLWRRSTN